MFQGDDLQPVELSSIMRGGLGLLLHLLQAVKKKCYIGFYLMKVVSKKHELSLFH